MSDSEPTSTSAFVPLDGPALLLRLPRVRGDLQTHVPLAPLTWFRVGGPAEVMFRPADAQDLADFLAACPPDVPITPIGLASNLLIRDGGVPGVVIRLGPAFRKIETQGLRIESGAAAANIDVARAGATAGIAGLEFLIGIPGSIGGGVRMNAGAYGSEFRQVLHHAHIVHRDGRQEDLSVEQLGLVYRGSALPGDSIVTSAILEGTPGETETIRARMRDIQSNREDTQPLRARTCGSTFRNPPGQKAWQVIEQAGCRGLCVGDAEVSQMHCNFLINRGEATAADIEALAEEVRRRVRESLGIDLEWEIRRLGQAASSESDSHGPVAP